MGNNLRLKPAIVAMLAGIWFATFWAVACSAGSEEQGRMRATQAQLVGIYKLGSERLQLKSDWTYVQDINSEIKPLRHAGQWRITNHLFDGSEVILVNAALTQSATPADKNLQLAFGDLPMYVHTRSGKVALARNEVADSYYERLQ